MKKINYIFVFALLALPFSAFASTITGTISYDGDVPDLKPIKMDADPICLSHHSDAVKPQVLVLGENKTLANVYVHITKGLAQKAYPPPADPVVVNQSGCMYSPHIIGIMTGQTMKILNPDGTLHNVHALGKVNGEFNLAMPKFRTEMTKTFDKPEFMFEIKCDVHPWMSAYITVSDNPYFDVTEMDGKYEIKDLPAGNYTLEIWHEKLGTQQMEVTLGDGETKDLAFTMAKPKKN